MNRFILRLKIVGAVMVGRAGPVKAANVAAGKAYAYFLSVPGQGAIHYFDDVAGLHAVHTSGLGFYDTGDLTVGLLRFGSPLGGGQVQ